MASDKSSNTEPFPSIPLIVPKEPQASSITHSSHKKLKSTIFVTFDWPYAKELLAYLSRFNRRHRIGISQSEQNIIYGQTNPHRTSE
jgi:hypothetical protein